MHNPYQPPGPPPPGWGQQPPPQQGWQQPQHGWPPQQPFGAPLPFGAVSPYPPTPEQAAHARETFAEREIADFATHALIGSIGSFLCAPFGLLGGPFAIWRSNHALSLIERNNVGHRYATRAKIARIVGGAAMLVQTGLIVWWLFLA